MVGPSSQGQPESGLACTACVGECATVGTENQTGRDGKRIPLLERMEEKGKKEEKIGNFLEARC